jgi:hypothetical protein
MSTNTRTPVSAIGRDSRRGAVRLAAGSSALMAVIYLLIGLRIVEVIRTADDQPVFGFVAAAFFAALAAVLLRWQRPVVWALALANHLFVAYVYFDLAGERIPDFETWGLALRILQVPAILALGSLLLRSRRHG